LNHSKESFLYVKTASASWRQNGADATSPLWHRHGVNFALVLN